MDITSEEKRDFERMWQKSFGWEANKFSRREMQLHNVLQEYHVNKMRMTAETPEQIHSPAENLITENQMLHNQVSFFKQQYEHNQSTIRSTRTELRELEEENVYQCDTIRLLRDQVKDLKDAYEEVDSSNKSLTSQTHTLEKDLDTARESSRNHERQIHELQTAQKPQSEEQ